MRLVLLTYQAAARPSSFRQLNLKKGRSREGGNGSGLGRECPETVAEGPASLPNFAPGFKQQPAGDRVINYKNKMFKKDIFLLYSSKTGQQRTRFCSAVFEEPASQRRKFLACRKGASVSRQLRVDCDDTFRTLQLKIGRRHDRHYPRLCSPPPAGCHRPSDFSSNDESSALSWRGGKKIGLCRPRPLLY